MILMQQNMLMHNMEKGTYMLTKPYWNQQETKQRLGVDGWEVMAGVALPFNAAKMACFYIMRSTVEVPAGLQPWATHALTAGERVVDIVPAHTLDSLAKRRPLKGLAPGHRFFPDRSKKGEGVTLGRGALFSELCADPHISVRHLDVVTAPTEDKIEVFLRDRGTNFTALGAIDPIRLPLL